MSDMQANPQDEDDLGFSPPTKPSQLRSASDDDLFKTYRKMGYANGYPFDRLIEMEIAFRRMKATRTSSRRMELLTFAIAVLTAVLVYREFF
jgi:hypothetical protein